MGRTLLKNLAPYDWFDLHTQEMPRLWTPPPAVMKNVVELFNEDFLAHPHIPHVFSITCLMTHLRRNKFIQGFRVFSLLQVTVILRFLLSFTNPTITTMPMFTNICIYTEYFLSYFCDILYLYDFGNSLLGPKII